MSDKWNKVGFSDLQRMFFAERPREVDGVASASSNYYRKQLFMKILSRFEITGMPDGWEKDYFYEHLFGDGLIIITDTAMGVLPLAGGVTGINVFNHPNEFVIANPVLGNLQGILDKDGVCVKIQFDFSGVWYLVDRYAAMLAMCDSSICVNLMNTKATFIFGAKSKAQAATYQKMYDDIAMGKPAVFTKNGTMDEESFYTMPAKQNYVADVVQLTKRKIMNEFLTDIGIDNTNYEKKENMTEDEINSNNFETKFSVQHWLDNIKEGLDKANTLYGLNLQVRLRDYEEKGDGKNELAELG